VTPCVSVIIPTHNRAWCLERAIASVLVQTHADLELIVVDDGSIDETLDVIAGFEQDGRLQYFFQPRQGVSAARNAGVGRARGHNIAFLDSDDAWLPEKLEKQLAYMQRHPTFAICQTEEIWYRKGRRVNPRMIHRKQAGDIFEISLERCMISPSAVMFRRELWDRFGGFDERLPACEDYDLWLRITASHPVGLVEEALLIRYGGREDQLSNRIPALDRFRITALVKVLQSGMLTDIQKAAVQRVLKAKCGVYIAGLKKRGKHGKVRIYERFACMAE